MLIPLPGFSAAVVRLLRAYGPPELDFQNVQIDPLVLGFAALLCVLAGLGFGLAAADHAADNVKVQTSALS